MVWPIKCFLKYRTHTAYVCDYRPQLSLVTVPLYRTVRLVILSSYVGLLVWCNLSTYTWYIWQHHSSYRDDVLYNVRYTIHEMWYIIFLYGRTSQIQRNSFIYIMSKGAEERTLLKELFIFLLCQCCLLVEVLWALVVGVIYKHSDKQQDSNKKQSLHRWQGYACDCPSQSRPTSRSPIISYLWMVKQY